MNKFFKLAALSCAVLLSVAAPSSAVNQTGPGQVAFFTVFVPSVKGPGYFGTYFTCDNSTCAPNSTGDLQCVCQFGSSPPDVQRNTQPVVCVSWTDGWHCG